jgi:hypothetical protein
MKLTVEEEEELVRLRRRCVELGHQVVSQSFHEAAADAIRLTSRYGKVMLAVCEKAE